jgi:hypothetical protein
MRFPLTMNYKNSAALLLQSLKMENGKLKIEATGGRA